MGLTTPSRVGAAKQRPPPLWIAAPPKRWRNAVGHQRPALQRRPRRREPREWQAPSVRAPVLRHWRSCWPQRGGIRLRRHPCLRVAAPASHAAARGVSHLCWWASPCCRSPHSAPSAHRRRTWPHLATAGLLRHLRPHSGPACSPDAPAAAAPQPRWCCPGGSRPPRRRHAPPRPGSQRQARQAQQRRWSRRRAASGTRRRRSRECRGRSRWASWATPCLRDVAVRAARAPQPRAASARAACRRAALKAPLRRGGEAT